MITALITVVVVILAIYFFGNKILDYVWKARLSKSLAEEKTRLEATYAERTELIQKEAQATEAALKQELQTLQPLTNTKAQEQNVPKQPSKRPPRRKPNSQNRTS